MWFIDDFFQKPSGQDFKRGISSIDSRRVTDQPAGPTELASSRLFFGSWRRSNKLGRRHLGCGEYGPNGGFQRWPDMQSDQIGKLPQATPPRKPLAKLFQGQWTDANAEC